MIKINIPHEKIADFCRQNNISRLSFYGSVLGNNFKPESDIDILVEFISGKGPGFFGLSHMELELSQILGRKVDLRTPNELSKYFRESVLSTAQVEYAQ